MLDYLPKVLMIQLKNTNYSKVLLDIQHNEFIKARNLS